MPDLDDVVIVGGGPAGCILAARLSEDRARSVLLIEAGPDYGSERAGWPAELLDPDVVWPISHLWGYQYAQGAAVGPGVSRYGSIPWSWND